MNATRIVLILSLLGFASGCYTTRQAADDVAVSMQNRFFAMCAWQRCKPEFGDVEYLRHFKNGFKSGYAAVASGRDGSPPVLPPQKYWSVFYRNYAGQEKMQAWFNGYSYGAFAAENEGVASRSYMVTSGVHDEGPPTHAGRPGGDG